MTTREDVTRLFGAAHISMWDDFLERVADLVAEKEREACAKVCDLVAREIDDTNGNATYCAAAIRARGKNE
jgi:hypothetical protein